MSENHSNGESILCKYRPERLGEIVGQTAVVRALTSFVRSPYSAAFIFDGPSGVGKTAAAWALARELGCSMDCPELGGVLEIASGQQDGRAVDELLRTLRLRPLYGSGWRVAIVNEADCMTDQAETIWLDGLEHLAGRTVIAFTTNRLSRFTDRLIGRCEVCRFASGGPQFLRAMYGLVRRIWKAESGQALGKLPENLGRFELASGGYSIRLALQQIAPYLRSGVPLPASFQVPIVHDDGSVAAHKAWDTRRARAAGVR